MARPIHHRFTAAAFAVALILGCSDSMPLAQGLAGNVIEPANSIVATSPWTLFSPGVISDARWQYRIAFTPNGRTAYYTVSDAFFPAIRRSAILESHMQPDGSWSTPDTASFSGEYTDIDPFLTPDGQRLYFSSIRPLAGETRPDLDIFYMERTPHGWGQPVRLGSEVNTAQDELYPSLDAAGTLYFAAGPFSPSPASDWNIYSAQPSPSGFEQRMPIESINTDLPWNTADVTADWEFNPEISVDGNTLVFTSLRPGGYGAGDLYVSHRVGGEWTAPVNLGPHVNTAHDEFHPTLSRDRRTLYFARTLLGASFVPSDFYSVETRVLTGFRHEGR